MACSTVQQLHVKAQPRCVLLNLLAMLSGWARALALLQARGCSFLTSKLQCSNDSVPCHRWRISVLMVKAGAGVGATFELYRAF